MSRKKLTERQRRFVDEYVLDGNATQAAIRAGFKESSANQQGPRLLVNVGVAVEIRRRRAAMSKCAEVTVDRLIAEAARIAFDERPYRTAPKYKDKLDAINTLAKSLGLVVEKLRIEKAPADMTTEELEAAIAQFGYVRAAEGEKNKEPG